MEIDEKIFNALVERVENIIKRLNTLEEKIQVSNEMYNQHREKSISAIAKTNNFSADLDYCKREIDILKLKMG